MKCNNNSEKQYDVCIVMMITFSGNAIEYLWECLVRIAGEGDRPELTWEEYERLCCILLPGIKLGLYFCDFVTIRLVHFPSSFLAFTRTVGCTSASTAIHCFAAFRRSIRKIAMYVVANVHLCDILNFFFTSKQVQVIRFRNNFTQGCAYQHDMPHAVSENSCVMSVGKFI